MCATAASRGRCLPFYRTLRQPEKSYFYSEAFKMSKEQLKHEINKVLDQFSDSALEELLSFLKQLESNKLISNSTELNKILSEDKQLLEKLAR